MADKQALGARADLFAAHNSKQAHDVVAAVAGGRAVAAGSGVAAGSPRRSRDAVAVPAVAADSRPLTR